MRVAGKKFKGITIEIGGDTTPLQKSLEGVNKKTTDLQTELRQVERLLKLDPSNTDLITQKQKLLSDAISGTKDKLELVKDAERQVKEQFEQGKVGEDQYRAIQREVVIAEQELKKLETTLQSTNDKWKIGAKELSDFGDKAQKAGEKFAPISAIAGAAVAGMAASAVSAGAAADDLNTLSKQTGISTESLQKFAYASDIIDVSTETMTGSLRKLTKSMGNAQDGSKGTVEAFQELGVSFKDDVTGELRDNEDVFYDIIDALGEIENETERDKIAMELFGKSAQDINPLILGGADALKSLGAEAEASGLIMSQEALDGANAFNDELDSLKANAKMTFMEMGVDIATSLTPALQSLASGLKDVMAWIRDLSPESLKFIMVILAMVAGIAPLLIGIGKLATGISSIMTLISTVSGLFAASGAAAGAAAGGAGLFSGAIAAITGPIGIAIAVIVGLIAIVMHLWKTNEEFRDMIKEIWSSIQEVFSLTIELIKAIINVFIEWFKAVWTKYGDDIKKMTDGLWQGILGVIRGIIEIIKGIIQVFIGIFTGDFEKLKTGITTIWKGLWEVIRSIVSGAWSVISGAFGILKTNITSWFTGIVTSATGWGKNLIGGFIDGIKSMAGAVADAVSNVIGGVKDFIGFNSPSKKGEGRNIVKWGSNMLKGFTDGILEAIPELENTMSNVISRPQMAVAGAGGGSVVNYVHSGTVRVEGVNNKGETVAAWDEFMGEFRRESRR